MGRHKLKLKKQGCAYPCGGQFLWFTLSNRSLVQKRDCVTPMRLISCSDIGNQLLGKQAVIW